MPVIVEFRLQPSRPSGGLRAAFEPTTRQLHGLACALFETGRASDDAHVAPEKPFAVWPLRPAGDGWLLRGAWLPPGFPQSVLASAGEVRLGPVTCAVTDVALHSATHEELADVPPVDGTRLTLLSPAYFAQSGAHIIDPDPRLIAGSWRRRWNASLRPDSGMHIDAALWRDIHLALHVTGSGLCTEHRDTGYRQQEGLTGTLTIRLESGATPAVRQAFGALSRFAEYCGTGAQVTHGFGATKTTLLQTSWTAQEPSPPISAKLME